MTRAALLEAMEAQHRGNLSTAISTYQQILTRDPRDEDAWLHLGIALHRADRKDLAETAFHRCLALNADSHAVHLNLGMLHFSARQFAEARPHFETARRLDEADPRAVAMLGRIALDEGAYGQAAEHFQAALVLKPDDLMTLRRLVRSLSRTGAHDEALEWIRLALDRDPSQAQLHIELAMTFRKLARHDEAIEVLQAALSRDPENVDLRYNLGAFLEERGEFHAASTAYGEVLSAKPDHTLALSSALRSRTFRADHPLLCARAEALLQTRRLESIAESFLRYAAGKHLDAIGEHERAMMHFHRANALQRLDGEFEPAAFTKYVDEMIRTFTPELMQRLSSSACGEHQPLFIVGLPRSGTTLVEQILSSHPRVAAGGEITFFLERSRSMFVHGRADVRYPEAASWLDESSLAELREAYIARLARVSRERRVTDKMPFNFQHLGLIRCLFPRAKIVYCRRDPLDNCLSCYFENLAGEFRFATSLEGLGRYYREHSRLMDHWRRVLGPEGLFEIQYESLVEDFRPHAEALLAHCGLPWDERCARFFEAPRVISTPSNWQVRQPIYSTSVGRWRAYEQHLGGLRAALGQLSP